MVLWTNTNTYNGTAKNSSSPPPPPVVTVSFHITSHLHIKTLFLLSLSHKQTRTSTLFSFLLLQLLLGFSDGEVDGVKRRATHNKI